jgi:hypothetical protein
VLVNLTAPVYPGCLLPYASKISRFTAAGVPATIGDGIPLTIIEWASEAVAVMLNRTGLPINPGALAVSVKIVVA